ncbi:MAG TPA: serine/threonine protein kinase [Verrucomicrobiae bacterium]|jgi:hypothetical protein|nr:serine/threonine protein kinase [Verrucomicrobiae bacterium]
MRDWVRETILKQDLFSRVERGHFAGGEPAGQWVMRDTSCARWWTIPLARFLERHEVRALKALKGFPGMPQLHMAQGHVLVRSWIPGAPLQVAKPSDPAYYRGAFKLLVALHRHGIAHNDLAKEPNWLVTPEGDAAVTDFQLAWVTKRRRRSSLFRLAAREDLRHMLKHKRKYCAQALTAREKKILASRSLPSRIWMATGKRVYIFITRRIFHWADREGAHDRQFPPS